MSRRTGIRILLSGLFVVVAFLLASQVWAVQSIGTLRPTSTVSNTQWVGTGTANGTCVGICDYIDETTSDGDTSYLNGAGGQAPQATFGMGGSSANGQRATSIVVTVVGRSGSGSILGYPPITVSLTINGGTTAAPNFTYNSTTYQNRTATFSGSWTKSQVDAATVTIQKGANGLQPAVRISTMYATITWEAPVFTEDASRLYENVDSATPGTPLAGTNTLSEVQNDAAFRMRLGITPGDITWLSGAWGVHSNAYNLQYAGKTAASCAAQVTGWSVVQAGSGTVRWYNNPSVADGASISAYANDPTTSGTIDYQKYQESNNFTLANNVNVGDTALWDFSLQVVAGTPGDTYCFRVVQANGTPLGTYSAYPEATVVGDYSVTVIDAGGAEVVSPFVAFPSTQVSTSCQDVSATLGQSSQKLRIQNDILTDGWDVSIAATDGSGALWDSGSLHYDFNDIAGCSDDLDTDGYGGALQVDPSGATVSAKSGCSSTGVSAGSQSAFIEGSVDAISLVSADNSSERFCYWDVTGIDLEQIVPAATGSGNYTLDMTITMTAQ